MRLDFDAARKEQALKPVIVVIDGAEYELPLPIPASLVVRIAEALSEITGDFDIATITPADGIKMMPKIVDVLRQAEPFKHFVDKLSVEELTDLIGSLGLVPNPEP